MINVRNHSRESGILTNTCCTCMRVKNQSTNVKNANSKQKEVTACNSIMKQSMWEKCMSVIYVVAEQNVKAA